MGMGGCDGRPQYDPERWAGRGEDGILDMATRLEGAIEGTADRVQTNTLYRAQSEARTCSSPLVYLIDSNSAIHTVANNPSCKHATWDVVRVDAPRFQKAAETQSDSCSARQRDAGARRAVLVLVGIVVPRIVLCKKGRLRALGVL